MSQFSTKRRNKFLLIGFCIVNSFFMLWLTFFIQSLPYSLPDEYLLIQATSVTKNLILKLEKKPDTTRFLFINVAWDRVLADKFDPDVADYRIGVEPITDRKKLGDLLDILAYKKNYKFAVFDINFKGATEHDSVLTAKINQMPNFLVSYHRDEKDKPDLPDLKIKPLGLSDIEKVYDQSLKFKIFFNDSIKATPLLMYEKLHKKKFTYHAGHLGFDHYIGNKAVFNSFILDYRIRNYDYQSGKYSKIHLGEFLTTFTDSLGNINPNANPDFLDLVKNRIIFVGDFEDRDIHETIYGKTPGPIILLDAFLALEAEDNFITLQFIIFLLFFYFVITYITFNYTQIYGDWLMKITFKRIKTESFLESMTVYLLYFAAISIISFFLFNIHIGVMVLAFYMNLLEKAKKIIQARFAKKPVPEAINLSKIA